VPITGADILRIEREQKVDFWQFACRWADTNGFIARKYAPHFHFRDEPETPFVICLRHVDSTTFAGTTKCCFLDEQPPTAEHPRGVSRCSIYGSRPGACRAFPTKLNATGELAVIYDVPDRGRLSDTPAYNLCPEPWKASDFDPIRTVQDLVVARYEMAFFHQLARLWNRTPRPFELFPDYVRLAYEGRVVHESDLPGAAPADEADEPRTLRFPTPEQRKAA
jgi:Fe-S-cluster containining protein